MIDPLTAFSTAASALQFADLAVKLIRKCIEYSAGGGSSEHQALQDLIQQLTVSNAHLLANLDRDKLNDQKHGPARALYHANEECLKIAQEVYQLLDGLKLNRTSTIWRSVKLALKTLTTKEKFQSLFQRLEHARANLTLSLMVYLQYQSTLSDEASDTDEEASNTGQEALCESLRILTAQTNGMAANVADLTAKFDDVQISEQELTEQWESALHQDSLCLQPVFQKTTTLITQFNDDLKIAREEVQRLLPVMSVEVLARRKILESLFFGKMHSRRNRVTRAHKSTYQWLFKHKEDSNVVWHDFVDWLCHHDEQSVYWISGKPGSGKTTLMRELDQHVIFKATSGASDVILPQQESNEWLNSEKEAGSCPDSHKAVNGPHTKFVNSVTELQLSEPSHRQSVLQDELTEWVGRRNLLTASRYFWYAGGADERSNLGLLRSLTHQLLSQRPDLIDKVIPSEMWYSACCQDNVAIHWEETDLIATLQSIGRCTQYDDKILLLVDGLDECHGTDDEQEHLLGLIKKLTQLKHVKACVASRPWNIFRDAFRDCPQLRLEDLTKGDIEKYAVDGLREDYYFQQQGRVNATLLSDLSQTITDRARGVFLWVRLVVRDLQRFLRDGGRPSSLMRELDRIPRDLDLYFERMIGDIEKSYRKDAAMILLTALCRMDFEQDDGNQISGPDFLLIHLDYLSEEDPVNIAGEDDVDSAFDSSRLGLLERLDRRLASRCMGLLEIDTTPIYHFRPFDDEDATLSTDLHDRSTTSASGKPAKKEKRAVKDVRIEFLHRTVRDFLILESQQQVLRDYAGRSFDPHWFRCNMLVLDAASYRNIGLQDVWAFVTVCFFRHIFNSTCSEETFKLYEKMVDVLQTELRSKAYSVGFAYKEPTRGYEPLAEAIIEWSNHCNTALSLAIQLGWKPYVTSRLNQASIQQKQGRSLLDHALRPCYNRELKPDPKIVEQILELGGHPDLASARVTPSSTWIYYFESLQYYGNIDGNSTHTIIRALLDSGIHRDVSRMDLLKVHRDLCRRPLLDQKKPTGNLSSHWVGTMRREGHELNGRAEKAVSLRLQPLGRQSEEGIWRYSALDVLRSLTTLVGPTQGQALFTEDEIATFENSGKKQNRDAQILDENVRASCKRQRAASPSEDGFLTKQPRVRSWDLNPKRAW